MSHNYKTVVVDFDDTLAFHQNRDFDNAFPNVQLISKLQRLRNEGWKIKIATARGSISCKTREEAYEKYAPSMIRWMERHKVPYDTLSFDKELAAYYVDDKGITPEDFLKINFKELQGGLSGSDIYTDGKFVHKIDPQAELTREWFQTVKGYGINTPEISRIVGNSITMEYIDHDKFYVNNYPHRALGLVIEALNKMRRIEPRVRDALNPHTYKDRICKHAYDSQDPDFSSIGKYLPISLMENSFSHGDFGITNMLFKDNELYLIDPLPNVHGCTLIDSAKFIASLYINKKSNSFIQYATNAILYTNSIQWNVFKDFVAAEAMRVYKYHPDKEFMKLVITDVSK